MISRLPRVRPLLALLLSGVLAAQVLLAGVGVLCVAGRDGMGAMHMVGAPSRTMAGVAAVPTHASSAPQDGRCDGTGAVQCVAMTACTGGAVVADPTPCPVSAVVAAVVRPGLVSTPHSVTRVPELPPPRV